ncbi:MAG TPA: glucoamylase family protein [Candidatus Limnocylindrales bacterium]|nr:glucoamylase family protein [Candidatus Limnocylindrales bacterium]
MSLNRRRVLGFGAGLLFGGVLGGAEQGSLSPADEAFLEDVSRRSFRYFWEQGDPKTGITRGRARFDGSEYPEERRDVGSTGDTGFGLTAMCIGAERKWVGRGEARERVRNTLRAYAEGPVENEHGWFYHWINVKTGKRTGATFDTATRAVPDGKELKRPKSEISTSDATWLVCGAITAREYFRDDAQIGRLANRIYERMDYAWMRNGHPTLLAHGWMPESGFLPARYEKYCQLAAMYLLGMASPAHALPADAWYAWERNPYEYDGYKYIGNSLLWTYQYPFAWFDLRGRREARGSRVNYFENSSTATRAHRQFCIDLDKEFPGCYSKEIWGITSSMSKSGYKAWGGPPKRGGVDGSVVPCAPGGSLMFTPDIALPALRAMRERFGDKIYGRYGFADAFHPVNGWVSQDTIALDVGITLLSAENLRSGNVWKWFTGSAEAQRALRLAELKVEG